MSTKKVEETTGVKVKALPKNRVAVHQIVRAIPSTKAGKTEFETIEPGQRFAASKEELESYPVGSYADYKAPAKSADDDIELDPDLDSSANGAEIDPLTGLPKVPAPTDDV